MTNMTDLELFRQALMDARNQKVDEVLRSVPDNVVPSAQYLAKMQRLLNGKRRRKLSKKSKWMIALVAALLALLVGCAAYVYRHKIADFIEGIYDKHATVVSDAGADVNDGLSVNELYTLTYVPEGYVLEAEDTTFGVSQIWKDDDNNKIIFNQHSMKVLNYLDVERSASSVVEMGEQKIYYRKEQEADLYIWTDDTYIYKLTFSQQMPETEVIKIIENIQVRQ